MLEYTYVYADEKQTEAVDTGRNYKHMNRYLDKQS